MAVKLFDGSSSDEEDNNEPTLQINEEYARRYDHNKTREDLQRFEELKKKGLVDDEDDDEESTDDEDKQVVEKLLNSKKRDLEFFEALIKVKKQDPCLKDAQINLFHDVDENEKNVDGGGKGKKPMYLKDVIAKQLIEDGPEIVENVEDDDEKGLTGGRKSYVEEQEELRKEFLDAVGEDSDNDDDGELWKVKENNGDEDEKSEGEIEKKLDEYFGNDEKLGEGEIFLKKYFKNKMWVDNEKDDKKVDFDDLEELSDDEKAVEAQEEYELEYNFRHEENVGDRVLGHSRFVEGSVRKKTSSRKAQRKSKEERKAIAEFERKEELKHLKNLKKKEIIAKLSEVKEVAGIVEDGDFALSDDDLEKEFDPEEHDRKMEKMFGDEYYGADDVDPKYGSDGDGDDDLEKPDFEKEDELLGLHSGEGFVAAREKILKRKLDENENEDAIDSEDGGKRKRKRKVSLREKVGLDSEWDEYHKLDYEDTIGDLKTRFKYAKVNPKKYGLSVDEILIMDDSELNQYVSLKKLAPYRATEWKVPRSKRSDQKTKNKLLLKGRSWNGKKKRSDDRGPGMSPVTASSDGGKVELEKSEGDAESTMSRRSRRRRRQAELKLSQSRLMAYGKIPQKAKKKTKY